MIPALVCLALLHAPCQDPPRLRTLYPNGAVALVERMPQANSVSVQLFASSRMVPETKDSHGLRHLLEHLMVKGANRDLDRRLESKGMFLRAYTMRDAMRIEVTGSPTQLQDAIDAIAEVLRPVELTQEQIDKEMPILESELALQDDAGRLAIAAWQQAYGDAGLDPLGSLEVMRKADPEALRQLQRKHFYPENLAVVVAGPVDLDDATKRVGALIGSRQGGVKPVSEPRPAGKPGRIESEGFGEGRGALVGSFIERRTVAALAAALSIASEFEGSFVTYTPSVRNGLITVGQTAATGGLGVRVDSLTEGELPRLFMLGKALARSWYDRQMTTPTGLGYLRGLLLVQGPGYRPEVLKENIEELTFDDFKSGMASLKKENAVVTVAGL
jgi:hypothetical protein